MSKQNPKGEITRRGFIKGAALGATALAVSGVAVRESKADTAPKKWDMKSDIVVVGAGFAGLTAAVEAAETGASVILIEKQPMQGGSSAVSTGSILCTGSSLQKQEKVQDSPDALFKHLREVNQNLNDETLVRTLSEKIGKDINWLSKHGVEFIPGVYTVMGSPVARALVVKGSGAGLTTPLLKVAKQKGVKVLFQTQGERLFQEPDGTVIGISMKGRSGKIRNIKAENGVILCSGGFCSSSDFLMRFATSFYHNVSASAPGSTGDGVGMALRQGADLIHMDAILPTPTVEFGSRIMITSYVLDTGAGILLDEDGKRFCNETGGYFKTALAVGERIQRQSKNKFVFEIFGKNAREKVPRVASYVKAGFVMQAETLEELAGKLGVDSINLKTAAKEYNAAVANQKDVKFGRQSLKAKLEPRYGAIKIAPGNLVSSGGLRINKEAQVVDMDGKSIKGLYAAGEVSGGITVRGTVGGDYLGAALVFGRIAGRNAAVEKTSKS